MASRRTIVSLARASVPSARTATPAHLRAPAHFASRQYRSYTPRQQLSVARQSPPAQRNKASSRLAITRPYSTDSGAPPSKIWDFEAVCPHIHPHPSPSFHPKISNYLARQPANPTPATTQLHKLTTAPHPSITIIGTAPSHHPTKSQPTNPRLPALSLKKQTSANPTNSSNRGASPARSTSPSPPRSTASTSRRRSLRTGSGTRAPRATPRLCSTAVPACAAGLRRGWRATRAGRRSASIRGVGWIGRGRGGRWRGRGVGLGVMVVVGGGLDGRGESFRTVR